jgi:hypothetical protein
VTSHLVASDSTSPDPRPRFMTPETRMGGNQADVSLRLWPYRTRPLKENADSDSSACYEERPKQQSTTSLTPGQPLTNRRLPAEADEDDPPGTSVPGPTYGASSTHPASTQRATMRRASQHPPPKTRGMSARPTASQ